MVMVKLKRRDEDQMAQAGPRSLTPPPRRKKRRDREGTGCRIVVLAFVLLCIAAFAGAYKFRELYTSIQPGYVQDFKIREGSGTPIQIVVVPDRRQPILEPSNDLLVLPIHEEGLRLAIVQVETDLFR